MRITTIKTMNRFALIDYGTGNTYIYLLSSFMIKDHNPFSITLKSNSEFFTVNFPLQSSLWFIYNSFIELKVP